jgi:PTS system nitrogen regulatory IIA component
MKLADLIQEVNIIPELKAKDKKGVLEELAEVIADYNTSIDKNTLVRVLLERERLGSTGIGDGVAIPHGKFHGISHPIISFGRSRKGLDFESMDGQPAYLFFLLVAPENAANLHLKAIAKVAKLLKNSHFRKILMEASSREQIYQTIVQNDEDL